MTKHIAFYDTCMRIGRTRTPKQNSVNPGVPELLAAMERFHISEASVEHTVCIEASPRLGYPILENEIKEYSQLRPAWYLMPDVNPRIEKAVTDPQEFLDNRVTHGKIDALDFCNGKGDKACFAPVLEACASIHLPVFFDFRWQGDIMTFDFDVCGRYPDIPFVIEGKVDYPLHKILWYMKEYPNLHVSTVLMFGTQAVSLIGEAVGVDRIIFGSHWPALNMGVSLGTVLFADITPEDRQKVAGGNFRRLIKGIGN